jgi:hypothetical protein
MSWHGRQGKGATRTMRDMKRAEADARNTVTPPEKRKANRRNTNGQPA